MIICAPGLLDGQPCIAGTWIAVAHVLDWIAGGQTVEAFLVAHPHVTAEGVRAALEYAAAAMRATLPRP